MTIFSSLATSSARFSSRRILFLTAFCLTLIGSVASAQKKQRIPHAQDRPPGPALSPQQALKKMTVPPGFTVELVTSEPDIVNPVAMTIDERGRFWITESVEYPRRSPGKGRDRIKVLEDTNGDGKLDKVTIFADGLNIPSGIAVGYGGVWVANSPDILFLQDTNGDGRADRREVIVTGFGRTDTHELPNSLTWGPDGWLYGINGVFNYSLVKHQGKEFKFTCTLFRIHPRTHEFQLFCEGTSNAWGVTFNHQGSAFISACVIDHLWHLTETGYYHRQGGPYPPFTWKIGSIVKHHHQKAAYCGIHFFDSDAYPKKYRDRLYMGNIHGGCVNVDKLQRAGSSYFATPEPDFLSAHDAWFMPVAQKTGPDGCLYVLDWYDRYHCYQDANRDPKGIDRLKGRLYRIRYKGTPRAKKFDMGAESDEQLIRRLHSPNIYYRDIAQRLLTERNKPATRVKLRALVLDDKSPYKARMHALWALVGGGKLDDSFHQELLSHKSPTYRAWAVRAAGNAGGGSESLLSLIRDAARDRSADVQLQVAIAARKIKALPTVEVLMDVLNHCGEDKLIPHIVWQNLHPLLDQEADTFVALAQASGAKKGLALTAILPRAVDRIIGSEKPDAGAIVKLFVMLSTGKSANPQAARQCLAVLAGKVQSREITGPDLEALQSKLAAPLAVFISESKDHPLRLDAALLSVSWGDNTSIKIVRRAFANSKLSTERRLESLQSLVAAGDTSMLTTIEKTIADEHVALDFRAALLSALGRLTGDEIAKIVLGKYAALDPTLKPRAIELLTQRPVWARQLLIAIDKKNISPNVLNANQVRRLLVSRDKQLVVDVRKIWGDVRVKRDPAREKVIGKMRDLIRSSPGDPHQGVAVFKKVCAQCHTIYGEGETVGPDITVNGRSSLDQLLSNVFDPSLVIGASYRAVTLRTEDGRVLTGLPIEQSKQRVVLKTQGGKIETIPRGEIEEIQVSELSMMPEDLEKQLKPAEIADLFAFLTLDRLPSDPLARQLAGMRRLKPRLAKNKKQMAELIGDIGPGFATSAVGLRGVEMLSSHFGRAFVVRTHPIDEKTACVLSRKLTIPKGKRPRLIIDVSHHGQGNWRLIVKADGKKLHDSIIGPKSTVNHWATIEVDLSKFAGRKIKLELHNRASDWNWEYAYWGRIVVVAE